MIFNQTDMLIVLCAIIAVQFALIFRMIAQRNYELEKWMQERDKWQAERKDLLDRIQAPSFAEYAGKVIREKKAEQPKEEEKRIEFVT